MLPSDDVVIYKFTQTLLNSKLHSVLGHFLQGTSLPSQLVWERVEQGS